MPAARAGLRPRGATAFSPPAREKSSPWPCNSFRRSRRAVKRAAPCDITLESAMVTSDSAEWRRRGEPADVTEARTAAPPHVVGIGASAGGLDPLVRFFDSLPRETGMSFVIVQHLSPDFKSLMD